MIYNGRDGVLNHQPRNCLLNRLYRRRSKKTSKLRATGLCAANSPVTCEFPAPSASNAENVSIWWRHHELRWDFKTFSLQLSFDSIIFMIIKLTTTIATWKLTQIEVSKLWESSWLFTMRFCKSAELASYQAKLRTWQCHKLPCTIRAKLQG